MDWQVHITLMNVAYRIVQHKQNADWKGEHNTWKKPLQTVRVSFGGTMWLREENIHYEKNNNSKIAEDYFR